MAEHADVGVGIDQAGVDVLPGGIENVTAFRQGQMWVFMRSGRCTLRPGARSY
jgi:hypothetical protein